MSIPSSDEFKRLAESAQQVLSRVEQFKLELEELRPQSGCSAVGMEALAIEIESLIAKARELRTDLETLDRGKFSPTGNAANSVWSRGAD